MTVTSPISMLDSLKNNENYRLGILNSNRPESIENLFKKLFNEPTGIDLIENPEELVDNSEEYENTVGLFKGDELIQTTPLKELQKYTLLVEPEAYADGIIDIEDVEYPDILKDLDETRFEIHSDADSKRRTKIPLILMSRYIEYTALQRGDGTLRVGFQNLERLKDEYGTKDLYTQLFGKPSLDVYFYGKPTYVPSQTMPVITHVGNTELFKHTWFVVYQDPLKEKSAALFSYEDEPGHWTGFWTFDQKKVDDIEEMIAYKG